MLKCFFVFIDYYGNRRIVCMINVSNQKFSMTEVEVVVGVGGLLGFEVPLQGLLGVAELLGDGTLIDESAGVALMVDGAAVMVGIVAVGSVDKGAVGRDGGVALVACLRSPTTGPRRARAICQASVSS